ncbi:hypothetical protein EJR00_17865 [Salmonella enterica]|nr:hypothetical protein [Salmonella enterica]EAU9060402.1 hypothetical protein [Salmonella enterica]
MQWQGIVTAKAVTLFESSLRCGASGALRLPCPDGHQKRENHHVFCCFFMKKCLPLPHVCGKIITSKGDCPQSP